MYRLGLIREAYKKSRALTLAHGSNCSGIHNHGLQAPAGVCAHFTRDLTISRLEPYLKGVSIKEIGAAADLFFLHHLCLVLQTGCLSTQAELSTEALLGQDGAG